MAENTPVTLHRNERVLAFMIAATLGLSLLAIIAMFVAAFAGIPMSGGVWPVVVVLPLVGFPIGFILIVIFLILGILRRTRAAKDGR